MVTTSNNMALSLDCQSQRSNLTRSLSKKLPWPDNFFLYQFPIFAQKISSTIYPPQYFQWVETLSILFFKIGESVLIVASWRIGARMMWHTRVWEFTRPGTTYAGGRMITVYGTERDAVPCHAICGLPVAASEKYGVCSKSSLGTSSSVLHAIAFKCTWQNNIKQLKVAKIKRFCWRHSPPSSPSWLFLLKEVELWFLGVKQPHVFHWYVHAIHVPSIMRIPNLNG